MTFLRPPLDVSLGGELEKRRETERMTEHNKNIKGNCIIILNECLPESFPPQIYFVTLLEDGTLDALEDNGSNNFCSL
jgi:hypothetical protein